MCMILSCLKLAIQKSEMGRMSLERMSSHFFIQFSCFSHAFKWQFCVVEQAVRGSQNWLHQIESCFKKTSNYLSRKQHLFLSYHQGEAKHTVPVIPKKRRGKLLDKYFKKLKVSFRLLKSLKLLVNLSNLRKSIYLSWKG